MEQKKYDAIIVGGGPADIRLRFIARGQGLNALVFRNDGTRRPK